MTISTRIAGAGFSLALAIIGVVAVVLGLGYGMFREGDEIGDGFLPVVLGAVITVLAVIDIIQRMLRKDDVSDTIEEVMEDAIGVHLGETAEPQDSDIDIFGRTQRQRNRILLSVVGALVVAVLLASVVGLVVALTLLMIFVAVFLERRPWLPSVIIAVVAGATIWLVFEQFLKVPLPGGLLGWL